MRRVALRLVLFLLLLAAVVEAAIAYRIELATAAVRWGFSRAGFPGARFRIERLEPGELIVLGIDAGEALRLDRVEVSFDLRRLPGNPLQRVRAVGARLDLSTSFDQEGQGDTTSSGQLGLGLLPVLEIEDARVKIPSGLGPLSLRLGSRVTPEAGALHMRLGGTVAGEVGGAAVRAEARRDESGKVAISVEVSSLRVRHPRLRIADGSARLRVDGDSAGLDLASASGRMDLSLAGVAAGEVSVGAVVAAVPLTLERHGGVPYLRLAKAELGLPAQGLQLSGISGDVSSLVVDLQVERLADTASAPRFEPLSVRVRLPERGAALRFVADVTAAAGRAALHAEGIYESSRGRAEADVSLARLEFRPGGLRPADLTARLATVDSATGSLEGTTHLRWESKSGVSGAATVQLDDLSLAFPAARIEGLTGTIALARLFPPRTAAPQTFRIRAVDPGVGFSDALLRWALEPAQDAKGSRLRIERFQAGFVGGKIVLDDALLDPFAATNRLDFRIEEVEVARILEIAGLEGVSGDGRLTGGMPVAARANAVAIPGGKLTARNGWLRVQSQSAARLLAAGGQPAQLLLDALRNFHYDELTLTAEKAFDGDAQIRLHLEGNNPDLLAGRAFRINLNLTGNLDRLTHSLLEVAQLSDRAMRAALGTAR